MLRIWLTTGILLAGMTVASAAQCDSVKPTRDWSYQPTGATPATLWNPLLPGTTGELQVIAVGDSVVWGNGDMPGAKIVDLVGQQLADATHRPVHMTSWAHSGAHLVPLTDGALTPVGTDGTPLGDLNATELSTTEQATCAAQAKPKAELVILDGCINDVGSLPIALPFPFNWTDKETIQRDTYTTCSAPMSALLTSVNASFPNATVIVLNYFQIISEDSRLVVAEAMTGVNGAKTKRPLETSKLATGSSAKDADSLEKEQQKIFALHAKDDGPMQPEVMSRVLRTPESAKQSPFQKWRDNSIAFLDTSQGCFTWAITKANGTAVPPLPTGTGESQGYTCPEASLTPAPATTTARSYLAVIDNVPGYAYGAKLTHLWKIGEHDQMYDARKKQCKLTYKKLAPREECVINPAAHPRPEGAKAYADSIAQLLKTAWGVMPAAPVAP